MLFEEGEWFYTLKDSRGSILAFTRPTKEITSTFETKVSYAYPILVLEEPMVYTEATSMEASMTMPTVDAPEYEYSHVYYDPITQTDSMAYLRREVSPEYTVTLFLTDNAFSIYDAADWHLMEIAQQNRYYLIGGLIAGLLLFAILLVYLCCAAGRRPGSEEVTPQGFNRLPLDLYAIGGGLCIAGLVSLMAAGIRGLDNSVSGASFLPQVVLIGCAVMLICVIVVAFLMACAAQMKLPGIYWLRHTATVFLCVFLWKAAQWCWRCLAAVCKWLYAHVPPLVKTIFVTLWRWIAFLWKQFCALVKKLWQGLCRAAGFVGKKILRGYSLLPLTWQWMLTGFALILIITLALASQDPLPMLVGVAICIAVILYGSNCFGILMENAKRMSKGDLQAKISDQFLTGSFKEFAGDLNALAGVAVVAAENQMKSERMKAELVTNVSHDIKTPLTSIINYVDLLKSAKDQQEAEEYLEVLDRQSQRLKKLIDDLMEMSKASTGNMTVNITTVDAAETINQSLGEFADKLDSVGLIPIFQPPEEPVYMQADGRLAWRVLSNLLSNAVKYSLPGTRLYVDLVELEGQVLISLKNISKEQLNISSEELMERFVRGDTSRNTEGSGLGLNIAKSLMDLQNGQLQLLVDGDLFKATLIFRAAK